jgi:hypothetical protein
LWGGRKEVAKLSVQLRRETHEDARKIWGGNGYSMKSIPRDIEIVS